MDQSFAPADAIDKKRLKALSTRSDGRGLAQLVEHAALLGLTGYGVNWSSSSRRCTRRSTAPPSAAAG
jgi:hypothetical protein